MSLQMGISNKTGGGPPRRCLLIASPHLLTRRCAAASLAGPRLEEMIIRLIAMDPTAEGKS
jgi:hypothetical protein